MRCKIEQRQKIKGKKEKLRRSGMSVEKNQSEGIKWEAP
jgi:hypothetical protein